MKFHYSKSNSIDKWEQQFWDYLYPWQLCVSGSWSSSIAYTVTTIVEVIIGASQRTLKVQCTKFSTFGFFHQMIPPRVLIHGLKPF
jgi:hypothetical protein